MESHPVPQNVTAFEFHLIGNMTMRQFGYLATGLVIAYISFLLFFTTLPLLAWPLIIIPSLVGAAYAFLPIMERPLDYWTKAFIKAIRKPTFRKYSSKDVSPEDPKFKERLEIYLHLLQAMPYKEPSSSAALHPPPQPVEEKEEQKEAPAPNVPSQPPASTPQHQPSGPHDPVGEFMQNLSKLAQNPSTPKQTEAESSEQPAGTQPPSQPAAAPQLPHVSQMPTNQPNPSEAELDKTVSLAREAQIIQNRIMEAEKQINDIKAGAATQGMDPKRYTEQFQSVLSDLQKLNQKARDVSHELAELSKTQTNPLSAQPATKPNIIPTLTLTSIPNIINGIVTDTQGNYIEGAIIVAHDKGGLPVRALKTNKLGQFIAATPLPSGTYTISVEKDDLGFDVIQIDLDDKILNPIVISAKKGATL